MGEKYSAVRYASGLVDEMTSEEREECAAGGKFPRRVWEAMQRRRLLDLVYLVRLDCAIRALEKLG